MSSISPQTLINNSESSAKQLAKLVLEDKRNILILMSGEMGSGKTTFTQFFAKALGISNPVKSPSFVGLQEYHHANLDFLHFDLYQVATSYYDLKELLIQRPLVPKIIVIEWAEKLSAKETQLLATEGLRLIRLKFIRENQKHLIYIEEI